MMILKNKTYYSLILKTLLLTNILANTELFGSEFVTTKSNKVKMRTGPGRQYPTQYIFQHKNYPLKIEQKTDFWYQVSDFDKKKGWIYVNLLSTKTKAIVSHKKSINIYHQPGTTKDNLQENKMAIAEPGRILLLKSKSQKLINNQLWHQVQFNYKNKKFIGWILYDKHLWGV